MAVLSVDWISYGVSLLLVSFGVFYIYAKIKLTYWERRGVPSPPVSLIFGNFKDAVLLRTSPSYLLYQIYQDEKYFPYMGFYIFHKPCLLIRSPELIRAVLIEDFDIFSDRQFYGRSKRDVPGTQNLFAMNNPQWKYARSKISPATTSGNLKKMIPLIIESAEIMMEYIDAQPINDKSVKSIQIKDTSSKYTTDVISSLAFGIKTNSFQTPEPDFRTYGRKLFDRNLYRTMELFFISFFPELCNSMRTSMLGKSENFFRNIFWNSVNSREKSGRQRGDLIDSLIKLKNQEQHPEYKFTGDYLLAHSATFFLAGHETSSLTMAFSLMELAKQPELQEKARREIREQFEKYGVTQEAFQEMKYVNQIIFETLRMYPPVPYLDRIALKDYQVPDTDLVIKKGTGIFISLLGLHIDSQFFPEPEKFDPERFSEERRHSIPPMTYMPFGEGPRYCIGRRIGLLQTTIGLSMILSKYEVSLNPDIDKKSMLSAPLNDINLCLKKITP